MKQYTTKIRAIDPVTGELKTWCGPNIPAISWGMAELWCHENAGYLEIDGQLEQEIDEHSGKVLTDLTYLDN